MQTQLVVVRALVLPVSGGAELQKLEERVQFDVALFTYDVAHTKGDSVEVAEVWVVHCWAFWRPLLWLFFLFVFFVVVLAAFFASLALFTFFAFAFLVFV